MEEPKQILEHGFKVKINDILNPPTGMMIAQDFLERRTPGINGVILGYVPGHGGDVYWVFHGDSLDQATIVDGKIDRGQVSAYGFWEFEKRS